MKMREAAEVTLSIMGVFSIVSALIRAPNLAYLSYMYFANAQEGAASRMAMTPVLLRTFGDFAANLVGGVLLVLLAGRIADWLVRRSASAAGADVELRIVSPEGFRFCVKLVGISVLISGVAMLARWEPASAVAGALTVALGLYLTRGGGWLTRFAWGKPAAR